jgi:hypothetical protein
VPCCVSSSSYQRKECAMLCLLLVLSGEGVCHAVGLPRPIRGRSVPCCVSSSYQGKECAMLCPPHPIRGRSVPCCVLLVLSGEGVCHAVCPPRPICCSRSAFFNISRTARRSCGGTPFWMSHKLILIGRSTSCRFSRACSFILCTLYIYTGCPTS